MTLSMVYLRLTLLSAFAIIALVCISYAHSSDNENTAVTTLKGRPGIAGTCISPSGRAITGNSENRNSMLEKTCNY